MKKHRAFSLASFVAATLLLTAGAAHSAPVVTPAAGDIFLGVRVTGGTGSGTSYIVNIGNDSTFRNATAGTVLDLGTLGTDLTETFGSNWHSRSDLYWGVFGTRNQANPVVYGSREQSRFGSSSAGFPPLALAARTSTNTQIISFIDAYANLEATTDNAKAAKQINNATSASYNYQVATEGTSDFGGLSGWTSIEGNFNNGARRTALDLFRYAGNTSTGINTAERLGSFTITSNGSVSFLAGPVQNKVQIVNDTVAIQEDGSSAVINLERLGDSNATPITVTFSVTDGTATAGFDYTAPVSLSVDFATNEVSKSVAVPVINRTGFNGTRSFTVNLLSATGGFVLGSSATSTVTITDIDPDPGALAFTASTFSASVADTSVQITLERTIGTVGAVSVDVAVTGGSLVNGAGYSFTSPTTVNFADGATSASTTLTLSTAVAGTIQLGLSNPSNFSRLGAQTTATVNVAGAPGTVSFGASSYSFPESSGVVNIPVVRTVGLQGEVSVTVSTANGTATAPADYTAISGVTFTLNEGQSSLNIPVTLFNTQSGETNETFTITISSPTNGASLGAITTATVRIEEFDTVAPKATITAPAPNASIASTAGPTVNISGTATDDKGLDRVEIQLNGGAIVSATLAGNANLTTATFSRTVTPQPGLNSITVQSVDATGNVSSPVTRSFTYVVNSPLTVNVDGSGTLPTPFPGTDNNRQLGKSYTLKATPAAGSIFAGWTGTGVTGTAAAELPTLTFTHTAGLVLTAKFIQNPFSSAVIGEYSGLIKAINPANASVSTEGYATINVTGTGTFTGTAKVDGLSIPLTGALTATGDSRFGPARSPSLLIPRLGKTGLVFAFNVNVAPAGARQATGTLGEQSRSATVPLATLQANRASYSKTQAIAAQLQGLHTLVLPAQAQTNGLTSADFPQGDGVGSVTVTAAGVATFSGTLADGVAFTSTAPLTLVTPGVHTVALFAQPYTGKGAVAALVTFDPAQAASDLTSTSVLWYRPYISGQYYPFGWLEGVTTQLVGAKYTVPAGASVIPGLPAVNPVLGNATLVFSDGKLATTQSKNVNISTANLVTKVPVTNPTYTLAIDTKKGDISGTFTHTNGSKPAFVGKIIQKGTNGGAYGHFLTVKPKVIDGSGESGGISLNHK